MEAAHSRTTTAFVSYSHEDGALVRDLDDRLKGRDVIVWRDETNLRVGVYWPKALGDAIRRSDAMLLFWSSNSQRSEFVEFEWNTAIALKKRIVPILLDDTELPNALKARQGVRITSAMETAETLRNALNAPAKEREEAEQQDKVLQVLAALPVEARPRATVESAKRAFLQHGWIAADRAVMGIVKRLTAVAVLVSAVIAAWFAIKSVIPPKPIEGQVQDQQGSPLDSVRVVFVNSQSDSFVATTNDKGLFSVAAGKVTGGTLIARGQGFQTWIGTFDRRRDTLRINLKRVSFRFDGGDFPPLVAQLTNRKWEREQSQPYVKIQIWHPDTITSARGFEPAVLFNGSKVWVTTTVHGAPTCSTNTGILLASIDRNPRRSVQARLDSSLAAAVKEHGAQIAEVIDECVRQQLGW